MRMHTPLSDYSLYELEDVLEGLKRGTRLINGEPLDTPDDWLKRQMAGKNG